MVKTLKEFLDTELSPDIVKDMDTNELIALLLRNNIVKSEADIRMLIVEGIQKAMVADDEFPITYYTDDKQEIPPEHRYVDAGPTLTDEYIENNLRE